MARVALLHSIEYYHTIDHPIAAWDHLPFGLSLIAGCLERAGHEVRCWVICPRSDFNRLAREIVYDFGCEMVGAGAVTTQFPRIALFGQEIKSLRPSIPILLGGIQATVNPEKCIADPAIDAVCVGEGEDAAVAWVDALASGAQPSGIPGLWIKSAGRSEVDRTPPVPFRADLDELPLINYDHWQRWVNPRSRSFRISIGRGCIYSCTYCSNHVLRRVQPGRYLRFRSPSSIVAELQMVLNRFPDLPSIYLEVETVGASIPWALELCDQLAAFNATRPHPIAFRANLSVTTHLVEQEERLHALLSAFRRANLRTLNVGLESGSERIRKDILHRPPYTNADLIRFCSIAHQYGISVALYVMVGVPTETPAEAVETAKVARACDPVEIAKSIYYPYPATQLYNLASEMHLFNPDRLSVAAERSRIYLKLRGFPAWRIFFEYVFITWRVFHSRRKTNWVIRKMLGTALKIAPEILVASLHLKSVMHFRRHPVEIVNAQPLA